MDKSNEDEFIPMSFDQFDKINHNLLDRLSAALNKGMDENDVMDAPQRISMSQAACLAFTGIIFCNVSEATGTPWPMLRDKFVAALSKMPSPSGDPTLN